MRDAFIRTGRVALGFDDHDTCPQCGTTWVRPAAVTVEVVAGAADRYAALLDSGREQPRAPGVWTPSGYTLHTGDWLGIWGERLIALAEDPTRAVPSIDPDALAEVRGYRDATPSAALHTLRWRARELLAVFDRVGVIAFEHPSFGPADSEAVMSWLAHEVDHHAWDVARLRGLE